jgi:hypothetical protein
MSRRNRVPDIGEASVSEPDPKAEIEVETSASLIEAQGSPQIRLLDISPSEAGEIGEELSPQVKTKTCKYCGKQDDESNFPSAGWMNGKQYRRSACMSCYWHKVKKPRMAKDSEWYYELKSNFSCKCGVSDHRVLDFHHLDRNTKSFNVADARKSGVGRQRLLDEIAKCECLCANCHRIRTWEEQHPVAA